MAPEAWNTASRATSMAVALASAIDMSLDVMPGRLSASTFTMSLLGTPVTLRLRLPLLGRVACATGLAVASVATARS